MSQLAEPWTSGRAPAPGASRYRAFARICLRVAQARWLHRSRIIAWGGVLLLLEAGFLSFLVAWYHNVFGPVSPVTSDFVSFYAAGKLALAGTPYLAYDQVAHAAAEMAASEPGILYQYFFYPPVFLLLCAPLALMPYLAAFLLFQGATLGLWLMVMRRILQETGWTWCIPVLAFPSVFWTLGQGQNSFLTAALLGATTLLLDRRTLLSGIALGLVCYKPHLALLAPVALAAGGYWRSFFAAGATVAVLAGLSAALFGIETWQAYLTAFAGSSSVYETGRIDFYAFVTPYGAARVLGANAHAAHLVQAGGMLLTAALVGWIWRCSNDTAVRAAALVSGLLLSAPLALVYDVLLLTVALAWLVRKGRTDGYLPWEKLAMFFCFLVPLLSRHIGREFHVPIAPLACVALLALCVVRVRQERMRAEGRPPVQLAPA